MNFEIPIEQGAVQLVAMICRIGSFVLAFPFFNGTVIPGRLKILLTIVLAFSMLPFIGDAWTISGYSSAFRNLTTLKMFEMLGSEVMLGMAVALVVESCLGVFSYAGSVMDMDVGFNASAEFDPTGETRTIFAYVLVQLFILFFLIGDFHLEMVKIVASSFQSLPPGAFVLNEPLVELMIRLVNSIFLVGLQMAMPIMAAMFLIKLGMAILARIGQDFPVMVLSFAINLGVGLLIFTAILPSLLEMCRIMGEKLLENLLYLAGA